MSDESNPQQVNSNDPLDNLSAEEAQRLRQYTRSPHPYLKHGLDIAENRHGDPHEHHAGRGAVIYGQGRPTDFYADAIDESRAQSTAVSVTGSESGTEADDERPNFIRALPPPTLRPRKGLKVGENEEALLTPSQLDEEGRQLNRSYFRRKDVDESAEAKEKREEEQEKLFRRRLNEFARRTSEVGLVGVILLAVLYGKGVWSTVWQWKKELSSQLIITILLILAYPIKLSIIDTRAIYTKSWQRFRVPASFDPATVLYPPFLPILVALTISPLNNDVILPNIILGLSSLPQRLFPRSSRLAGINVVHWFVAIIPMLVSENTNWPFKPYPAKPYQLKAPNALPSEVLVSLYPLHHALMQPLQYLTTTSLLMSELHLLSVALINILLFASTPQTVIIKACLWVGGLPLFLMTEKVLHWNIILARVPKWKLRRPGHSAEERRSLVDAVSDLVQLQRVTSAFKSTPDHPESDADEDETADTLKQMPNGRPKVSTQGLSSSTNDRTRKSEPRSAIEARGSIVGDTLRDVTAIALRPRRNTVAEPPNANVRPLRQTSARRKSKSHSLLWCLQLTPMQAMQRKWSYAAFVYSGITLIILGPVRIYVSKKALNNQEPIGWALGYLFGQIPIVRTLADSWNLDNWFVLPAASRSWQDTPLGIPPNIPAIRASLGAANVRLLLIAYWALVLLSGLLAVFSLTAHVEVDTRRKIFHGTMVAMLLPSTFVDPCACALALALILAVFLLLEVIRAGQVPPLGNAISRFVAPYVDGRDLRGPVVVSHIFLLIGCAVPLWFSLAGTLRASDGDADGWELHDEQRDVGMIAGVVCVGMGDAAASLIGRRYGRHKWLWVGGKSLEGSAAFVAAVVAGLMFAKAWLVLGGWRDAALPSAVGMRYGGVAGVWAVSVLKATFCACGASFMEAVLTGANDNVVVPVVLWLLVKGTRL